MEGFYIMSISASLRVCGSNLLKIRFPVSHFCLLIWVLGFVLFCFGRRNWEGGKGVW